MAKKKVASAVGYCKPPLHTRFAKGVSGNPKGRPKGSSNILTSVKKALDDTIVVQENGRQRRISKLDAAVIQMVNKAVKGDLRAFQLLTALANMVDGQQAAVPKDSAADAAALKVLLQRINGPVVDTVEPADRAGPRRRTPTQDLAGTGGI